MLNKQKGNMYGFVTHTWNVIKGICPHDCSYCYMKRGKQKPLRFCSSELKTDLKQGNFIFVGSSCDMFAEGIKNEWIKTILDCCMLFDNKYLFQSKNPDRFYDFHFPKETMLATTIESNRDYGFSKAPELIKRAEKISIYPKTMVTIEPIMDFDLYDFLSILEKAKAQQINIGANSRRNIKLPEPPKEKILALIEELKKFTKVYLKPNLRRLTAEEIVKFLGERL